MAEAVIVYNAGGTEVLHKVSPKKARKMLYRQIAIVKDALEDGRLRALELLRYVFPKWKHSSTVRHYSKRGVLLRDDYTCGYCRKPAQTIDHITPRCAGGKSTWENTVAACFDCNARKGGRSPQEAGMKLLWKPTAP